jgi:ABC-type glycerol-3-phosphate transport system substrate-binding protein
MKKALALFLVLALALTAVSAGFAQDDLSGELEIFSWLGR